MNANIGLPFKRAGYCWRVASGRAITSFYTLDGDTFHSERARASIASFIRNCCWPLTYTAHFHICNARCDVCVCGRPNALHTFPFNRLPTRPPLPLEHMHSQTIRGYKKNQSRKLLSHMLTVNFDSLPRFQQPRAPAALRLPPRPRPFSAIASNGLFFIPPFSCSVTVQSFQRATLRAVYCH